MCQKYPGPRCSAHAKEKLDRSQKTLTEALEQQDVTLVVAAMEQQETAQAEYDATPAGLEELKRQAQNAYWKDLYDEGDALHARWNKGDTARKDAIRAAKILEETGRLPTAKPVSRPSQSRRAAQKKALAAISAYHGRPGFDDSSFRHAKQKLAQQANKNRNEADRQWEAHSPTRNPDNWSGNLADSLTIAGQLITTSLNPDAPLNRHSKERLRIAKQLNKLNKEYDKAASLEIWSVGQPENLTKAASMRVDLDKKAKALKYDLDLLSTNQAHDEHPQITRDRQQAAKRWSLMGSIEKLLA